MSTLIIIIIILIAIGSADDTSSKKTSCRRQPSRRQIRKARKACRRAEMDAYEDMLVYMMAWY